MHLLCLLLFMLQGHDGNPAIWLCHLGVHSDLPGQALQGDRAPERILPPADPIQLHHKGDYFMASWRRGGGRGGEGGGEGKLCNVSNAVGHAGVMQHYSSTLSTLDMLSQREKYNILHRTPQEAGHVEGFALVTSFTCRC
jgi:hypothetical protein